MASGFTSRRSRCELRVDAHEACRIPFRARRDREEAVRAQQPQRADRVDAPARVLDSVAERAHFARPEPEHQQLLSLEQPRSRRDAKLELEPVDRRLGSELEPHLDGVAFEHALVRERDVRIRERRPRCGESVDDREKKRRAEGDRSRFRGSETNEQAERTRAR